MAKKKQSTQPIEPIEPQEPSHDSPAGIILNFLRWNDEYLTWQQVKDKYTTEEIRQLYNTGVKIYRGEGFDRPIDGERNVSDASMDTGESDL